MSPTYFAVEIRKANEETDTARRKGDIAGMMRGLARQTALLQAQFGKPSAMKLPKQDAQGTINPIID